MGKYIEQFHNGTDVDPDYLEAANLPHAIAQRPGNRSLKRWKAQLPDPLTWGDKPAAASASTAEKIDPPPGMADAMGRRSSSSKSQSCPPLPLIDEEDAVFDRCTDTIVVREGEFRVTDWNFHKTVCSP